MIHMSSAMAATSAEDSVFRANQAGSGLPAASEWRYMYSSRVHPASASSGESQHPLSHYRGSSSSDGSMRGPGAEEALYGGFDVFPGRLPAGGAAAAILIGEDGRDDGAQSAACDGAAAGASPQAYLQCDGGARVDMQEGGNSEDAGGDWSAGGNCDDACGEMLLGAVAVSGDTLRVVLLLPSFSEFELRNGAAA